MMFAPDAFVRKLLEGRLGLALVAVTVLASLTACMSQERGDALQRDVARLKQDMRAEQDRSDEARKQLKRVMEQATTLSTRNSADAGVRVEQLQLDVSKLSGRLEQTNRAMEQLRKQLDEQHKDPSKVSGSAAQMPKDPDQLLRQGAARIAANSHEQGRRMIRHFIARFPRDPRVAKAQLALGDSYYAQQRFAPAIQEYRKILEHHKKSSEVPNALYKVGMSFYQLKYCSDAASFFRELLKKNPSHPKAAQAKDVLKLIRRFRRNRRVCSS
jgi:TolA-binding protein